MLKIVMDDMQEGEVAYMYQEGEDAVIVISRHLSDDVRCSAVNDLLGGVRAKAPVATPVSLLRIA